MEWNRLEERLAGADWVLTGEGRFDEQSLNGKVVSGVIELARRAGVKAGVIAGTVALEPGTAKRHGVWALESARPPGMPMDESCARSEELLLAAARRFATKNLYQMPGASDGC